MTRLKSESEITTGLILDLLDRKFGFTQTLSWLRSQCDFHVPERDVAVAWRFLSAYRSGESLVFPGDRGVEVAK